MERQECAPNANTTTALRRSGPFVGTGTKESHDTYTSDDSSVSDSSYTVRRQISILKELVLRFQCHFESADEKALSSEEKCEEIRRELRYFESDLRSKGMYTGPEGQLLQHGISLPTTMCGDGGSFRGGYDLGSSVSEGQTSTVPFSATPNNKTKRTLEKLQETLNESQANEQKLQKEVRKLQEERLHLTSLIQEDQKLLDKFRTRLVDERARTKQMEAKIERLETKLNEKEVELELAQKKELELKDEFEKFSKKQQQQHKTSTPTRDHRGEKSNKRKSTLGREIHDMEEELAGIREDMGKIRREIEKLSYNHTLLTNDPKQKDRLEEVLNDKAEWEKSYYKLERDKDKLISRMGEKQKELTMISERDSPPMDVLEELKERISALAEIKENYTEEDRFLEEAEMLRQDLMSLPITDINVMTLVIEFQDVCDINRAAWPTAKEFLLFGADDELERNGRAAAGKDEREQLRHIQKRYDEVQHRLQTARDDYWTLAKDKVSLLHQKSSGGGQNDDINQQLENVRSSTLQVLQGDLMKLREQALAFQQYAEKCEVENAADKRNLHLEMLHWKKQIQHANAITETYVAHIEELKSYLCKAEQRLLTFSTSPN